MTTQQPTPGMHENFASISEPRLGLDHGDELVAGHPARFRQTEPGDESNKPDLAAELDGEVGSLEHDQSPFAEQENTDDRTDLLTEVTVAGRTSPPPPRSHRQGLDWSNFIGPKRNLEWTPDDQDLIYTALNYRDDDYGDADEDAGQQLVERLLAAWKRAAEVPAPTSNLVSVQPVRQCDHSISRKAGYKTCATCDADIADPAPVANLVGSDPALIGIAEEMKESGGCWQPCTGCYDTEDGYPTQKYDFSPALQTSIGCGCHECGGLGAVWWHMTDEQVADFARICEEVDTEHQLKMRIVRLEAGLRRFRRAYVSLMESGRDKIISLGGSCDPVDVMEAGDPELRLLDAALASEGKS